MYKLNCLDCDKCYIGQTKQYLKNRIKNHKQSVRNSSTVVTALSNHAKENMHKFNFEEPEILCSEQHYKKRNIMEMIHISKRNNTINYRTDTEDLGAIYNNLLS